ncbi:Citrate synthase [Streptomyces atratus]|uniref:Citrate synthase n=1 Tax=Streptomyces atratus TaxID=1893 RepID=A0A1K2B4Y8_STRAR|nr:Citrate synthase [Streptomyces atratus]
MPTMTSGTPLDVPRGLAGVVVTDTALGDVRGREGFYHYRQYSAIELAQTRSFEDVWYLMPEARCPMPRPAPNSPPVPPLCAGCPPRCARHCPP